MKYLLLFLVLVSSCATPRFAESPRPVRHHYQQRQRVNDRDRERLRLLYTPSWLDRL